MEAGEGAGEGAGEYEMMNSQTPPSSTVSWGAALVSEGTTKAIWATTNLNDQIEEDEVDDKGLNNSLILPNVPQNTQEMITSDQQNPIAITTTNNILVLESILDSSLGIDNTLLTQDQDLFDSDLNHHHQVQDTGHNMPDLPLPQPLPQPHPHSNLEDDNMSRHSSSNFQSGQQEDLEGLQEQEELQEQEDLDVTLDQDILPYYPESQLIGRPYGEEDDRAHDFSEEELSFTQESRPVYPESSIGPQELGLAFSDSFEQIRQVWDELQLKITHSALSRANSAHTSAAGPTPAPAASLEAFRVTVAEMRAFVHEIRQATYHDLSCICQEAFDLVAAFKSDAEAQIENAESLYQQQLVNNEELAGHIRGLEENAANVSHVADLNIINQQLQIQAQSANNLLETQSKELADSKSKIDLLFQSNATLESELESARAQAVEAAYSKAMMEHELETAKALSTTSATIIPQESGSIDSLQQQIAHFQQLSSTHVAEVEHLRQENSRLSSQLDQKSSKLEESRVENLNMVKRLEQLELESDSHSGMSNELEALRTQFSAVDGARLTLQRQYNDSNARLQACLEEIQSTKKSTEENASHLATISTQRDDLKRRCLEVENERAILIERVTELEKQTNFQLETLRAAEVGPLRIECSRLSDLANQLTAQLAEAQQKQSYYKNATEELEANMKFNEQEHGALNEEFRAVTEKIADLEAANQMLTMKAKQIGDYETANAALKSQVDKLDEKLVMVKKQWSSKLENANSQIRQLEGKIVQDAASFEETITRLEADVSEFEKVEQHFKEQITALGDTVAKHNSQYSELQTVNQRLSSELVLAGKNADDLNRQLAGLESSSQLVKSTLAQVGAIQVQIEQFMASEKEMSGILAARLEKDQELDTTTLENLKKELEGLRSDNSNVEVRCADLSSQLESLKEELKGRETALKVAKEKEDAFGSELANYRKQNEILNSSNSQFAKEISALKNQLREHEKENLQLKNKGLSAGDAQSMTIASGTASGAAALKKKRPINKLSSIPENKDSPAPQKTPGLSILQESKKQKLSTDPTAGPNPKKQRRESIRLDQQISFDEAAGEGHEHAQILMDQVEEPQRSDQRMVIGMSGFKEGTVFDGKLRMDLTKFIKNMPNVELITGSEGKDTVNTSITHMITPPETKTLKTLSATLFGAWIITDPEWIKLCAERNERIDEAPYGFQMKPNPFTGKAMFRTDAFKKQCLTKSSCTGWPRFLEILWVDCSKGLLVDDITQADCVLTDDPDRNSYGHLKKYNWYQLMDEFWPQHNEK